MKILDESEKHYQDKNYQNAILGYENILCVEPGNITALQGLAKSLSHLGKQMDAERVINRALDIDPSSAISHTILANILLSQNLLERAENESLLALKIDDKIPEGYLTAGGVYLAMKQPNNAIAAFENGIKLSPSNWKLFYGLSQAYILQGNYAVSIQKMKFAIRYNFSLDLMSKLLYLYFYYYRYLTAVILSVGVYASLNLKNEFALPIIAVVEFIILLVAFSCYKAKFKRQSFYWIVVAIFILVLKIIIQR
jgi:tetratricopeptide (TPR) repeat protein